MNVQGQAEEGVMKCLNCNNEAVGRSKYCSDSCKVLWNRKQHKGVTVNRKQGITETVTPKWEDDKGVLQHPINIPHFGQPDCECMHCQANRTNDSKHTINHGPVKPFTQLGYNEVNRVSMPGDVDYVGVASRKGFNE